MAASTMTKTQKIIGWVIFAQALLAMLGSLYFSNFGNPLLNIADGVLFSPDRAFTPCSLCWYSRILMYPLVILSLVGVIKKDRHFTDYILPFSVLGILLSMYHYYLQMFPSTTSAFCTQANPCDAMQIAYLGFITIPFLAWGAYTVITVLCLINRDINKAQKA